ncbi:MAG: hypothetical protein ABIC68_06525 [Candidatus Omnitrophota bacterium]
MKKFFSVLLCIGAILFVSHVKQVFCRDLQNSNTLDVADIAGADKVELASEISFEVPAQPLCIIDDPAQIKKITASLKQAVFCQPCDCLPEYVLNFYKENVLLGVVSFGVQDHFLRYGGQDYTLPQELLSVLEL